MVEGTFLLAAVILFLVLLKKPHFGLWLIAFSLPFRFSFAPVQIGISQGLKITEIIVLLTAIAVFIRKPSFNIKLPGRGFTVLFLLFLFFGLLSITGSENFDYCLTEILEYAFIVLMMLTIFNIIINPHECKYLINGLMVGGVVSLCIGIGAYIIAVLTSTKNIFVIPLAVNVTSTFRYRLLAFLNDPNFFADYCLCIMIIALTIFLWERKFNFLLFSFLSLVGLFLSFSRSAWIIAVIGLILVLRYYLSKKSFTKVLFLLTVILLILLLLPFLRNMGLLTETKTRLLTVTEEENPRLYIWKAALNAFFSHPLLGIGIGSFKSVAYQYSSEMIIYQETHNVFLDILAGTGLLGFIFWLLSIFYILIAGIRNIKIYKQSSYEYILSIATLASFVVMLLHGFTLNISTVRHFWLIAIIILILNEFNLKKEKTD